ncbi:glycoside hydrolase family protein [Flavivirga eckloniae]|uniref:Uncharacterized protein n=1 Tax=Flavivirga eckloniae TaxID=1803846 RepID=A0A2K9PW18_9FLAO|nr:hypothetical protein [Flavivirga eckloniae]AUP81259.1 hypothetical protein C1H87_22085 [Flavivirga eckloniae]
MIIIKEYNQYVFNPLRLLRSISMLLMAVLFSYSSILTAQEKSEIQSLSSVNGTLQAFVSKDSTLQYSERFTIDQGENEVVLDGEKWNYTVKYEKVEGHKNATDVEVIIHPSKENQKAIMGVEFNFENWSKDNYVLVPASVYNGNRFKTINMSWPGVIVDEADKYHDIDPIIPDHIPYLNLEEGTSKLSIKLNDASIPAIAFFSPELQRSFLLLIKPTKNFDIVVKESEDRKRASFLFYSTNKPDVYSKEKTDFFSINFRMFDFPSQNPIDLLTHFFPLRKSFTEPNEFVHSIPFGKSFEIQETLHDTNRWDESMKIYRQSGLKERDKFYGGVQLGWIGGMIEEQPLLTAGNELSKKRSVQNIETILNNMQGESGLMYGMFKDDIVYSDDFRNPSKKPLLGMARKNGDALYFLLQSLMILKESKEYGSMVEKFESKARKLADGLSNLWLKYNQFGQFFDPNTGELVVYGSTSGASAIGALALACEYFGENKYLEIAEAAGDFYYRRDLQKGYTTAGPGEALQCPDSESAFAILEGYMALYDITGKEKYLKMAEEATAYFATWVTSYDFEFPEQSVLGKIDAKATGSVWANIQNRHGAPAICNYSGDSLLKLYRATNNPLYIDLLKDIAHNALQYVSTTDRPLAPNMLHGYVCERVNISNWEGEQNVGGNFYDSSPWVEVAIMQTVTQVPSIYFDVENNTLAIFDHLNASIENTSTKETITIRIKNPTEYDTVCTVFIDSAKDKPMGWNNYAEFKKIQLSANEEKVVTLKIK